MRTHAHGLSQSRRSRCQAECLGPLPALSYKRNGLYHDIRWTQYHADALAGAAALIEAGIRPGDRVGLVSENRAEWLIADMAILLAAAVNVPPHAPLSASQIHYQLADAGVTWLVVSDDAAGTKFGKSAMNCRWYVAL